jgi:hypothetical protein
MQNYPTIRRPSFFERLTDPTASPTIVGRADLLSKLVELEATDLIAYSVTDNRVRVRNSKGEVEFRQAAGPGGAISYHVISGADPLGWEGKVPAEAVNGKALSPDQWLAATMNTDFPDLPVQVLAYFRSKYAGDIAVFAAPGWDFFNTHHAGHGGVRGDDMFVPLLLAGPGVPVGRIEAARTVDLAPTLLHLLGESVPGDLDGRVLPPVAETR